MYEHSFLATIFQHRADDAPRLVYADWLEEHGQAEWAELIRLQIALSKWKDEDSVAASMQAREQALLHAHEAEWKQSLPNFPGFAWGPFSRGFPDAMTTRSADELRTVQRSMDYGRELEKARQHPHVIQFLWSALMHGTTESYTWNDDILSFLPQEQWPSLVNQAVDAMIRNPRNQAAESVLEKACMQCPESLHPHLETIFNQNMLGNTYYAPWPWRNAGQTSLPFLAQIIADESRDRTRAYRALLETRDPFIINWLKSQPFDVGEEYWREAGLSRNGDTVVSMHSERVWHIVFPEGYFDDAERPAWLRKIHPTWQADDEPCETAPFGGGAEGLCTFCGKRLHHLLTLGPVAQGIGVSHLKSLSLVACLSCLGWEQAVTFFSHSQSGEIRSIGGDGTIRTPQFPVGPLRETTIQLRMTSQRWYWQSWGDSNSRQNLHRIGGPPSWVQSADYPNCPRCEQAMHFLLQLDSDLPQADGGEWLWGSGGCAYCFWCDDCRISAWLWQCT